MLCPRPTFAAPATAAAPFLIPPPQPAEESALYLIAPRVAYRDGFPRDPRLSPFLLLQYVSELVAQ
jgi:hypothetical protein